MSIRFDKARMLAFVSVTVDTEEQGEYECNLVLHAKYEVCSRCYGRGSHVNPSIDGNGITSSEWENDWDDESREAYMSGAYDVTCHQCGGERVVLTVDEDRIHDAEQKRLYEAYLDDAAEAARERESELRWEY